MLWAKMGPQRGRGRRRYVGCAQDVPGVAELFEGRGREAVGVEVDGFAGGESGNRHQIPKILGDEIGGQDVDLGGSVGVFAVEAAAGADVVDAGPAGGGGRFDLDAEEAAVAVDDEVKAGSSGRRRFAARSRLKP